MSESISISINQVRVNTWFAAWFAATMDVPAKRAWTRSSPSRSSARLPASPGLTVSRS